MRKKLLFHLLKVCAVTVFMISGSAFFAGEGSGMEGDPQMTGLPELTQEELEWQNKHMTRVKKVKLNRIGLERVNAARTSKGLSVLTESESGTADIGDEIEGTVGEGASEEGLDYGPGAVLPAGVDNSILKFFPPIRTQGSLPSCGVFSGTYYAMTYMHALARNLDAKAGGDQLRFSPKWTYNMVNDGELVGSWYYWAYDIGIKHGCATWAEFPYVGSTSNPLYYREWCTDAAVWRNAVNTRFDRYGYVADTHRDTGIQLVKEMLVNGYILNIPTYISSWQWKTIGDDPATTADDKFFGKRCVSWVSGTQGYHGMTVVGYNDDIWVDINSNGAVDAGEKGAFRIANSWGTGWEESGFCWMSYDALKNPSAVAGGPSSNRIYGWSPTRAHWVTARTSYQPAMVGEFTVNHLKRNQLRITLGVSDTTKTVPTVIWYPKMIYAQGGPYAFDGTTTATDGTFVFDFTDIVPSGGGEYRYYVGMYDAASGDGSTLMDYRLIDVYNGNRMTSCYDLPRSVDAGQAYAYVDYNYDDDNVTPVADAAASPLSGEAPLTVRFDGTGSYDTDGGIASWNWNFGDGAGGSGGVVDHTYTEAGTYNAILTVTDDRGAADQAAVVIEVLPDPARAIHVDAIEGSIVTLSGGKAARVVVTITDPYSGATAGAAVQGSWSGLVGGSASGVTGPDGKISFTSSKTKKSGVITFTVTAVSKSGYTYDPSQNTATGISISTDAPVNQKPVAVAAAAPASGAAPLAVDFNGSGSYDSDGAIVSYFWNFGDGGTAAVATAAHTYAAEGTYTAVLTVTDNQGATDSDTVLITVGSSGPVLKAYVADIVMSISSKGVNSEALARVTIRAAGNPVSGATVTGLWSGLTSGSASGVTGADGMVAFASKSKASGTYTFTVTQVSAGGYEYDPGLNIKTSGSISTP
jgi:PKD repeat protein